MAEYLALVRSGHKPRGTKGSDQDRQYRQAVNRVISASPIQSAGYVIELTVKSDPTGAMDEKISRVVHIPNTLSFHQLDQVLQRALGFKADSFGTEDNDSFPYEYRLWDKEPPHAGKPMSDAFAAKPTETLLAEPEEHDIHTSGKPDEKYCQTIKSSKSRKLVEVFEGSQVWPQKPHLIEYEVCEWKCTIEYKGPAQSLLDIRPGQEAFCREGEGYPRDDDCNTPAALCGIVDGRRDHFDRDFVNERLHQWCCRWRQKQYANVFQGTTFADDVAGSLRVLGRSVPP